MFDVDVEQLMAAIDGRFNADVALAQGTSR